MPEPSAPGATGKYLASKGPRSLVRRKRASASALDQESLRMRRVDWFPRIASPTRGASKEQVPHDAGRELLLDQVEHLPRLRAGSSHEVAGVPRRLVQEARPGMASISVWVRPLVQYCVKVAVSCESSSVLG